MKKAGVTVLYFIYIAIMYLVFVVDRLLTAALPKERVSFGRWINNPIEKIKFFEIEYENYLMRSSIIRVIVALLITFLIW